MPGGVIIVVTAAAARVMMLVVASVRHRDPVNVRWYDWEGQGREERLRPFPFA